ncbi:glycosyltransferase family 10 domain-containing protein [Butyrivibrio sp. YAB3001]|uniref:glycosyltransferase family 10 domain-containing protein n=1 Tax=Butyrivibrio sp. YAB3001 TaxID=1520812 RepID=UPI0008F64558|nr:glycosyltransferase family 10 [Butyrivibrio sp. YAB3001]SFC73945.1 Glycosyltransferase family 10 (fucosyltransferase) C-term [Butyrivibrio sp. YAB3001]
MKKIVIAFSDVFDGFDVKNNLISNVLKEKYEVEIADAYNDEDKDRIGYLFYSAFGTKYLDFDCIRIFFTGENLFPNFNLCDYAIGFENMTVEDRFFRLPIYLWELYKEDYDLLSSDRMILAGERPEKRKFCGMVVSNDLFAAPNRIDFFKALSEYKSVASGGRAYNNIGEPDGVKDKRAFLSNYKFSIAFENSSYPGYCTEKLMQAFSAGNVPIYWGDAEVGSQFNKEAFIDCTGLTIEEAISKVKEYDENDELYLNMLREKPLVDDELREHTIQKFREWLFVIMDADYENARRKPLHGKMTEYENQYRNRIRREEKLKSNKLVSFVWGIVKK